MIFQPSEQQRDIFKWVQEGNGHAMVRALAGTGKTSTIIEAIRYMTGSVALVAYNKRIAEELQAKIKLRMKKREDMRAGTFHSFGFASWIRRHPGMKMEGDNEKNAGYWKWSRIIEELHIPRPDKPMDRTVRKLVSLAKQYGFGVVEPDNNPLRWKWIFEHFSLEDDLFDEDTGYMPTPSEIEQMMKACIILARRALLKSAEIAHEVIDYDDMLYMPLKDTTCRIRQYDWVLVDECQPAGTMVEVVVPQPPNRPDRAKNGYPTTKSVPIEELKIGDNVLSYSRDLGVFRIHGKPITKVTRRRYDGLLTEVSVGTSVSRYTANHWCWANFRPITDGYFTYLMRRGNQFRVGMCKGRYADSKSASGPAFRMYEENAEQMWLLERYDTKAEAQIHETINSVRYGIPMTRFVADGKAVPEYVNGVWDILQDNTVGAIACLEAHARDIHYPFFDRSETGMFPLWRSAKIRACNLMNGVLVLPFRHRSKIKQTDYVVAQVRRYSFSGDVYSLEVQDDHMYVADGLLTHNCQDSNPVRRLFAKRMMRPESRSIWIGDENQAIYGFGGADSESMNTIATEFEPQQFPLTTTYRCAHSIVRYAQDWTPDMIPREDAPEGSVRTIEAERLLQEKLKPTDAILCRNTAPLVDLALKLIRSGIGCKVEGRDIGQNLYKLAERWKRVKTVQILKERLVEYRKHQVATLKARHKDMQAEQVADTVDSLIAIIDSLPGRSTLYDLKAKITGMFGDSEAGQPQKLLTLSTIHKCVHPSTLTETMYGLLPIREIPNTGLIATPHGIKEYTQRFMRPLTPTVRLITEHGYSLETTKEHGITVWRNGSEQRVEMQDVAHGDYVKLFLGSQCESATAILPKPSSGDVREVTYSVPTEMTPEMAEFFGLMVADGTVYHAGFRLAKRYLSVVVRFVELVEKLFGVRISIDTTLTPMAEVNSTYLSRWLETVGGMSPSHKFIPTCVLQSPLHIQAAFLMGLFEDGTVNIKNGRMDHIHWDNCSPDVVSMVQTMLLRFGIPSAIAHRGGISTLYIYSDAAKIFAEKIGFVAAEKNRRLRLPTSENRNLFVPVTHEDLYRLRPLLSLWEYQNARARGYLSRRVGLRVCMVGGDTILRDRLQWLWQRVVLLMPSESETMCVEVPDGNRFLQNGFDGWNSKGREWPRVFWYGYNIYNPSPYATQAWEKEQESNLMYVAVTRAIDDLVKVYLKNKHSESPIVWAGDESEEDWDNEKYHKTLIHGSLSE